MSGAVLVAIAASIGNLLQGWDNATIAGAVLYIKKEFSLETQPLIEGLIVAMSLIGATVITTFSGAVADAVGRRPLLIASSVLYFVSGLVMLWAPNVYVLLLARLIDGFGIGLAVTLVPLYISETAPTDIRGLLNTLPQFSGSGGMFLSYCMVFTMSLMPQPDWRVMLGVLSIPSLMYFALTVFYLPESPRWLVSKGRMAEAKRVLQGLRGREDVSGEMALLVEGLGVGKDTHFEEYIIGPDDELADDGLAPDEEKLKLYGAEEGVSWIARPVRGGGQSALGSALGLMSRQATSVEGKEIAAPHGSIMGGVGRSSSMQGGEAVSSMGIGGGWQLAWKWTEREGADGQKEGGFQRIYLHEEGVSGDRRGSILSMPGGDIPPGGEYIQAAALVSQPALYSKDLIEQQLAGPAMVHPSEAVAKGTKWAELFEPGVKHALFVGIGLQILQQFAGINGVLYYTPQILEQAGVGVLLSNIGLSSSSASILISALTTLLMLPSIGIAMRLMDMSGRRFLLLSTIPVLIVALAVLVLVNVLDVGTMVHAALSTISVIVYFCFFVMGFGPIPNILCAEIFPTSVRGICIAICALTFWIGDIIVTYTLPVMLNAIGLAGVFGIYAVVCILAFVFVYMKVPETKGMPLEVITEFFSVGAKQGKEATD
ncbi:unnamed protein product [Triticum turgidum subsp. durum]|uniref:Major facilitator superfamily (MFS) profile domain-containing protein n=1 Tax=Triticum turgidum subsp. durum TaxID=4567 RepID=A0A9R0QX22_TRITD|nr:unnamed protein product [Triticum turgidum subsp. durum]